MRKAMRRWLTCGIGATTAALLMVGNAASATYAADQQSQDIHLTANFAATIIVDPAALLCGGFHVSAQGGATGSPIGSDGTWQAKESACLLTRLGRYDINGTANVSASDGDRFTLDYHLTASLLDGTTIRPSGTFQIKGGTGEYANATGGGSMSAVVPLLDTGHVSATLDGSLS